MAKFRVTAAIPVYVSIEVEAKDGKEALEEAYAEGLCLTSFVGNGGSDKLVGVYGSNMSVEPGEEILEDDNFRIEIEEI